MSNLNYSQEKRSIHVIRRVVEGSVMVQFIKPEWWDEWVEIDEEKVLKGEGGWSLKEGASSKVKREFRAIVNMLKLMMV